MALAAASGRGVPAVVVTVVAGAARVAGALQSWAELHSMMAPVLAGASELPKRRQQWGQPGRERARQGGCLNALAGGCWAAGCRRRESCTVAWSGGPAGRCFANRRKQRCRRREAAAGDADAAAAADAEQQQQQQTRIVRGSLRDQQRGKAGTPDSGGRRRRSVKRSGRDEGSASGSGSTAARLHVAGRYR